MMRLLILALLTLFPFAASAQVINACVKPSGLLRVVSDSAECKANENSIQWNGQGPQGEDQRAGEDAGAEAAP